MSSPPAIDVLAQVFGLTGFERQLLLLCAGVDMDSRLAERCAEAQGSPQKTYATFGLALALLPDSHWDAITPSRPLRRFRMLEVQRGSTLTSAPLRVDERILHYLAGSNLLDPRLQSFVRDSPSPGWIADEQRDMAIHAARAAGELRRILAAGASVRRRPAGTRGHRHSDRPRAAAPPRHGMGGCSARNRCRTWISLRCCGSVNRCCFPARCCCRRATRISPAAATHLLERLPGVVFVSTREPVRFNRAFVRFDANKPGPVQQKQLWGRALGDAAPSLNGTLDDISEQFRLSARMISSTGYLLRSRDERPQPDDLWDACRSLARPRLDHLAQRIVPVRDMGRSRASRRCRKRLLRQLAAQVRYRMKVYETWGFAQKGRRGLGVSALFTGVSGTGKTMAAEVLARELRLDLVSRSTCQRWSASTSARPRRT